MAQAAAGAIARGERLESAKREAARAASCAKAAQAAAAKAAAKALLTATVRTDGEPSRFTKTAFYFPIATKLYVRARH